MTLGPDTAREVLDRHVGAGAVLMEYEDRRTLRECISAWEADLRRLGALEERLHRGLAILEAADHQHYVEDAKAALAAGEEK